MGNEHCELTQGGEGFLALAEEKKSLRYPNRKNK